MCRRNKTDGKMVELKMVETALTLQHGIQHIDHLLVYKLLKMLKSLVLIHSPRVKHVKAIKIENIFLNPENG